MERLNRITLYCIYIYTYMHSHMHRIWIITCHVAYLHQRVTVLYTVIWISNYDLASWKPMETWDLFGSKFKPSPGLYRPTSKDQDVSKMESKIKEIQQVPTSERCYEIGSKQSLGRWIFDRNFAGGAIKWLLSCDLNSRRMTRYKVSSKERCFPFFNQAICFAEWL